jgi:hypothetical protein
MNKQIEFYAAHVRWVKSESGHPAPSYKLLSIGDEWNSETVPFVAYTGSNYFCEPHEMFLFGNREEAETFKHQIEKSHKADPRYFVIDDDGSLVLDEEGNPVVAWVPKVNVTPVGAAEVDEMYFDFVLESHIGEEEKPCE